MTPLLRSVLLALIAPALATILLLIRPVSADEVVFLNGDRLTGKIVSAAGGSSC